MTKLSDPTTGASRVLSRRTGVLVTVLILGAGIMLQWPTISARFPGEDDSGYLFDGVRLVEQGMLMPLGSGPLAGILNGAIYFFFPRDHMLLGDVSTLRRALLMLGIMTAVGLVGNAIGGKRIGWLTMVIAAVSRPVNTILLNTADSLYAVLSGLSFAILVYEMLNPKHGIRGKRILPWIGAGLFLGFGALARLDGLLLGLLLLPVLWLLRGRDRPAAREVLFFLGGFAFPVILFILTYGILKGNIDPQIGQRSYLAFEQGHNFLYTDRYEVVPDPSAEDLYGSGEENGYSVPRAILRNPRAFLARIPLALANAVRMYYNGYSILGGVMFLFLVAGGIGVLWKESRRSLLGLTLLWFIPLAGYLLASYRPGFFGTVFPQLLFLAMAGAFPILGQIRAPGRSGPISLWIVWILVAGGMVLAQFQFVVDQFRVWDSQRRMEQSYSSWLNEIIQQIPREECFLSFSGADAVYSNHPVCGRWQMFYEIKDSPSLNTEMQRLGTNYLVVNPDMQDNAPDFVRIAEQTLTLKYTSSDGSHKIFVTSP